LAFITDTEGVLCEVQATSEEKVDDPT